MTSQDISHSEDKLVNTITEGSVWRAVWLLSWPTMITMLLSTAYMWINRYFVGQQLWSEAITAVGLGGNALMVIFSLAMGLMTGTTALVARFVGARTYDDAVAAAKQSIILSVLVSTAVTLPFALLAKPILVLMGAKGAVVPMAVNYTIICVLTTAPWFALLAIGAILRGMGDMKTPLYISALVTAINIIGDYLLIYGPGPFPEMGVVGAAIAVIASRIVGVVASVWWLLRSSLKESLHLPWTPHFGWMVRILKIGVPALIQGLMFSVGFAAYLLIIGRLAHSTVAQAAWFVGSGAEAIAYMPGFAFMTTATSLVGQNLGAKRPDRAEHGTWICAWQCMLVMSAMAVVFYVFAKPLSWLFLNPNDPNAAQVVAESVRYLRINAISEPFFGLGMVFGGAMQGAGDTKTPTIVTFITFWVIRLPICYIWAVVFGGGAFAAWTVVCSTTILRGIIMTVLFVRGKWKTVEV